MLDLSFVVFSVCIEQFFLVMVFLLCVQFAGSFGMLFNAPGVAYVVLFGLSISGVVDCKWLNVSRFLFLFNFVHTLLIGVLFVCRCCSVCSSLVVFAVYLCELLMGNG